MPQANQPVRVRGATGPNGSRVTGVFLPSGELFNDRPLFHKGDDPNEFLLYAKDTTWMVTDSDSKEKNNSSGWGASLEKGFPHPAMVNRWKVVVDGKWEEQALVVASALVRPRPLLPPPIA